MKVKELIEQLQNYNQELNVCVLSCKKNDMAKYVLHNPVLATCFYKHSYGSELDTVLITAEGLYEVQ